MELGYTVIYVPDVPTTVDFYERVFGLKRRFINESNTYAEMETGRTALSFAAESLARENGLELRPNTPGDTAAGFEVCFVSTDPEARYAFALEAGARAVSPVKTKPWGQRVGYVRDLNGCLVELCSPMTGG